ncbi:MAG: PatB family C-S lyase [Rikenellaceae bacterium]
MKYDFENVVERAGASAIKTSDLAIRHSLGLNTYPDSIAMWVADMDFATAPEIVSALKRRAELATFGYSGFSDEYYSSVISWFARRHSMSFTASEMVYTPGTVWATVAIIRAFTSEGEGVIIQPPVYYPFKRVTIDNKRKIIENHLICDSDNHYTIDFEDFEAKCADPNNKLFIFCNPHNPIGQIWDTQTTLRLIEICEANDVLFFSDEVHGDLIRREAEFSSTLNIEGKDNIIVATAANKTFNLAGLHITNLIIRNPKLREQLTAYIGEGAISPFSEAATIAAYNECEEWVDQMNEVLDENMRYLGEFIAKRMPKVRYNLPSATYLAWLDFRAYEIEEADLLRLFADKAHVVLERGSMFGEAGYGFIRMNVACPKSLLAEALERMANVL